MVSCGPAPARRRRLLRAAALVALLVLAAAAAGLRPAPAAADVVERLDTILYRAGLQGPDTGVFVWDISAGREVYAQHATAPLAPASNLKLVTSAATLLNWGQAHRIPTLLLTDAEIPPDGALQGDLYLRGGGDPSLSTLRYQRHELGLHTASIEGFVRRLKAKGVRRVLGAVVGDDSWFDRRRVVVTWEPWLQDQCGRLGALSADESLRDGNRVKGPALHAAQLLTDALKRSGIKVDHAARTGVTPADATLLARQWSAPLARLLRRLNKDSDNFFAEVLLKGLGRDLYGEGSTDAGLQVSRAVLDELDAAPGSYRLADGSGLSYDNRLTPALLVDLLVAMYRRDDWDVFHDSLAVAGVDGTLEDRLRGTPAQGNAHAKTGSLRITAALSGYVDSADDQVLAFAIITNGDPVDYWSTGKAHDKLVAALARAWLREPALSRGAPSGRQQVMGAAEARSTPSRALAVRPQTPSS